MSDSQFDATGPGSLWPASMAQPLAAAPVTAPTEPATAGAMLRQLRESHGVDAGVLASAMKVSIAKLDALEHDRLELLPDVTFARALASAICRAFGVDPATVLAHMPAAASGLRAPASRVSQPFHAASDARSVPLLGSLSRPLLAVVAALLLGAALLWLWPTWPIRLAAPDAATPPAPVASEAVEVEPAPASEPVAATEPQARASEPAAPARTPVPATVAAASPLGLTASAESWVTVHDASGKPLFNRALQAGETVSLDGALPLSVTVGRKDAVQVTVHGQPFDIRKLGSSTVARFQVK